MSAPEKPVLDVVVRVRVTMECTISGYDPALPIAEVDRQAREQAHREIDRLLDRSSTSAGRWIRPVGSDVVSVTSTRSTR